MIFSLMLCITLSGCDKHEMIQDYSTKVGHILCTDGKVVPLEKCIDEGKTPIAVVNPAKRKAMAVKNEKRFLKQKRNALKNPGYSHHPVKTQASFKRLLKAV
jgi:hypothetical protein